MEEQQSLIKNLCSYRLQSDKPFNHTLLPMVTGSFAIWRNKKGFNVDALGQLKSQFNISDEQLNDLKFIIEELKHMDLDKINSITIFDQSEKNTKIWIRIDRWYYSMCYNDTMPRIGLKDMYVNYGDEQLGISDTLKKSISQEKKSINGNKLYLFGGIIVLLVIPMYIYYAYV